MPVCFPIPGLPVNCDRHRNPRRLKRNANETSRSKRSINWRSCREESSVHSRNEAAVFFLYAKETLVSISRSALSSFISRLFIAEDFDLTENTGDRLTGDARKNKSVYSECNEPWARDSRPRKAHSSPKFVQLCESGRGIVPAFAECHSSPCSSNFVHQRNWIRGILPAAIETAFSPRRSSNLSAKSCASNAEIKADFPDSWFVRHFANLRIVARFIILFDWLYPVDKPVARPGWPASRRRFNHLTHVLLMLNSRKYFGQGYRKWLILGKAVVNPRA